MVHEISEKTLTEISCIIRAAGSEVVGTESLDLLRRVLEGAGASHFDLSRIDALVL